MTVFFAELFGWLQDKRCFFWESSATQYCWWLTNLDFWHTGIIHNWIIHQHFNKQQVSMLEGSFQAAGDFCCLQIFPFCIRDEHRKHFGMTTQRWNSSWQNQPRWGFKKRTSFKTYCYAVFLDVFGNEVHDFLLHFESKLPQLPLFLDSRSKIPGSQRMRKPQVSSWCSLLFLAIWRIWLLHLLLP